MLKLLAAINLRMFVFRSLEASIRNKPKEPRAASNTGEHLDALAFHKSNQGIQLVAYQVWLIFLQFFQRQIHSKAILQMFFCSFLRRTRQCLRQSWECSTHTSWVNLGRPGVCQVAHGQHWKKTPPPGYSKSIIKPRQGSSHSQCRC